MKISVRYFAAARERCHGISSEMLDVSQETTTENLKTLLATRYPKLAPLLERSRLAINQQFCTSETTLQEHDEVAIIPPVAGGAELTSYLSSEPLSREKLVAQLQRDDVGAIVTFSGTVRNHARGKKVIRLHYEAFTEMAEKQLAAIVQAAEQQWPDSRVAIQHRIGTLSIGDSSVEIAAASPHRATAFEVCRFVIESIKKDLTIWKHEFYEDGEEWVEG